VKVDVLIFALILIHLYNFSYSEKIKVKTKHVKAPLGLFVNEDIKKISRMSSQPILFSSKQT